MLREILRSNTTIKPPPRLELLPTLEEVNQTMLSAIANFGKIQEVSWVDADTGITYRITAFCAAGQAVPIWELAYYDVDDAGLNESWQILWRQQTSDPMLVFNTTMETCGHGEMECRTDGVMYMSDQRCAAGEKITDNFRHFKTSPKLPNSTAGKAAPNGSKALFKLEQSEQKRSNSTNELVSLFRDLLRIGLKPETVLVKTTATCPISQVTAKAQATIKKHNLGCRCHLAVEFYKLVNGQLPICDLIKKLRLERNQWIPIVWALLNNQLLSVDSPAENVEFAESAAAFDDTTVQPGRFNTHLERVRTLLTDKGTGICSFDSLVFFLEYECQRAHRSQAVVSLVVISINAGNKPAGFSAAEKTALQAIDGLKRGADILASLEHPHTYGLLLPNTPPSGGQAAIERILQRLAELGMMEHERPEDRFIRLAAISVPQDAEDMEGVLNAAHEIVENEAWVF